MTEMVKTGNNSKHGKWSKTVIINRQKPLLSDTARWRFVILARTLLIGPRFVAVKTGKNTDFGDFRVFLGVNDPEP